MGSKGAKVQREGKYMQRMVGGSFVRKEMKTSALQKLNSERIRKAQNGILKSSRKGIPKQLSGMVVGFFEREKGRSEYLDICVTRKQYGIGVLGEIKRK